MHKEKTDWDKRKEKSEKNLGFISRTGAFRDPTPAEKAQAIAIETESWQASKGKFLGGGWKVSAAYSIPKGAGRNLRADRVDGEPINGIQREVAMQAYIDTPMDNKEGTLKAMGIDVRKYEHPKSLWEKTRDGFFAVEPDTWIDIIVVTSVVSMMLWAFHKLGL